MEVAGCALAFVLSFQVSTGCEWGNFSPPEQQSDCGWYKPPLQNAYTGYDPRPYIQPPFQNGYTGYDPAYEQYPLQIGYPGYDPRSYGQPLLQNGYIGYDPRTYGQFNFQNDYAGYDPRSYGPPQMQNGYMGYDARSYGQPTNPRNGWTPQNRRPNQSRDNTPAKTTSTVTDPEDNSDNDVCQCPYLNILLNKFCALLITALHLPDPVPAQGDSATEDADSLMIMALAELMIREELHTLQLKEESMELSGPSQSMTMEDQPMNEQMWPTDSFLDEYTSSHVYNDDQTMPNVSFFYEN